MDNNFWLEIVKLLSSFATPIVVVVLGVFVLRRIESVKAEVARQSDFHKKWAEQFFGSCQDFLCALEYELAILTMLVGLVKPNDDFGTDLQKEIPRLHLKLSELELRIRRCVVFAPKTGPQVAREASICIKLVGKLIALKQGNVDEIINRMNMFNLSVRRAHAEMLGVGGTEQNVPAENAEPR